MSELFCASCHKVFDAESNEIGKWDSSDDEMVHIFIDYKCSHCGYVNSVFDSQEEEMPIEEYLSGIDDIVQEMNEIADMVDESSMYGKLTSDEADTLHSMLAEMAEQAKELLDKDKLGLNDDTKRND
jgi:hypothetical protein